MKDPTEILAKFFYCIGLIFPSHKSLVMDPEFTRPFIQIVTIK